MAWLLDTNVLSELRKGDRAAPGVLAWFKAAAQVELFTSVLVMGEIRKGISRLSRRDPVGAKSLERWMQGLVESFSDRILPVTAEVADRWGRLAVEQPLSPIDGLLAATALHHGLILVTRNVADVARAEVPVINPFL
jgi:hypothetical protein